MGYVTYSVERCSLPRDIFEVELSVGASYSAQLQQRLFSSPSRIVDSRSQHFSQNDHPDFSIMTEMIICGTSARASILAEHFEETEAFISQHTS